MPTRDHAAPARPARAALAVLAALVVVAGCGGDPDPSAAPQDVASSTTTSGADVPTRSPRPSSEPAPDPSTHPSTEPSPGAGSGSGPRPHPRPRVRHVLAISVDGLNPDALRQLGPSGAPATWRLLDEGAGTLDARTELEQTVTLPNHTGMVTGRPVDPAAGGHGVTWNEDVPGSTVEKAAGEPVASVFTAVHAAGGTTAVFAGKTKFSLFQRSWPEAVDRSTIDDDLGALVAAATDDLAGARRTFTFVHLAAPDVAGHASGFMSPAYLDAVRTSDAAVGRLVGTVERTRGLAGRTLVVLTADHGGRGAGHSTADDADNYTIPFVLWGPGVRAGDLYDLSPGLADPGTGRPGYDGPQPARNCDVANVSVLALGLPVVPGSRCDAGGELSPRPGGR